MTNGADFTKSHKLARANLARNILTPPVHEAARWTRPDAYRTSVADPPRFPRLVVLRSSCGHALGIGYVWEHQGYIKVRSCR